MRLLCRARPISRHGRRAEFELFIHLLFSNQKFTKEGLYYEYIVRRVIFEQIDKAPNVNSFLLRDPCLELLSSAHHCVGPLLAHQVSGTAGLE